MLIPQQILDGVEVMPSSSVHNYAGRLVDNQKLLRLVNNLDRQVKNWRLNSDRNMHNLVPIFQDIVRGDYFAIDPDVSVLN